MAREYFCAYHSFREWMRMLTDAEKGRLFDALLVYSETGEQLSLGGKEAALFPAMKWQIDRDAQQYEEKCRVQSDNAKKRWDATTYRNMPEDATACHGIPEDANDANEKEKEKEKEKAKDNITGDNPLAPFDEFWAVYPKKVGKGEARKAFQKVKVPVAALIAAVEQQKKSAQWQRDNGQYIPYPATWLNQGRWEDEPEEANNGSAKKDTGEKRLYGTYI